MTDEEILAAIPVIARNTGVFSEPAAAAAYAGLVKSVEKGMVDPDERVVVLLTGSGLKDIASAMKTVPEPPIVAPTLEAVKAALKAREVVATLELPRPIWGRAKTDACCYALHPPSRGRR